MMMSLMVLRVMLDLCRLERVKLVARVKVVLYQSRARLIYLVSDACRRCCDAPRYRVEL